MGRRRPRPVSEAIARVRSGIAPADGLAAIQLAWSEIVGEAVATVTRPDSLRDGVLRVSCRDSVWAEELSLMAPTLLEGMRARFGEAGPQQMQFFVGDVTH